MREKKSRIKRSVFCSRDRRPLIHKIVLLLLALPELLGWNTAKAQTVYHIPADRPSIQSGILAAANGDTVLVSPGTYHENINFLGKAITVQSLSGPAVTIIDGGGNNPVVTFKLNEGAGAVLKGFTVQNGFGNFNSSYLGGGIYISSSSPTIIGNRITNNHGCDGVGIGVYFGSPLIQNNTIDHNTRNSCSGGSGGGGILIGGSTSAQIIQNVITDNVSGGAGSGGGISMNSAGTPIIRNNLILRNTGANGGGVSLINSSNAVIVQNVISNNTADASCSPCGYGGGIYASVPSGEPGPTVVNNSIVGNTTPSASSGGSGINVTGFAQNSLFQNNLVIGTSGSTAVVCGNTYVQLPPTFIANDVYSAGGQDYTGTCAGETGNFGNISLDPQFVCTGSDYSVPPGSPIVDAGNNGAPNLPSTDFGGNPRIFDGDGNTVANIDMGAYEFSGLPSVSFSPPSLSFPNQVVGTTSAASLVTLTNVGIQAVGLCGISILGNIGSASDFPQTNNCGTNLPGGASCSINVSFQPAAVGIRTSQLNVSSNSFGGTPKSASLSGTGANPLPTLFSVNPSHLKTGGSQFIMKVTGTNFVNGSLVLWNGVAQFTTFINSSTLQGSIPGGNIASGGTAQVTVSSPLPGGGTSNAITLSIASHNRGQVTSQ